VGHYLEVTTKVVVVVVVEAVEAAGHQDQISHLII
jgi:hypothetical protein